MSSQAPIDYQRFRRGESCTEDGCRARKFYIEDGKKFCQRGHEQAGFTQTQRDEDDWNTQGRTSRKKKEEAERVITVVSGNDAKELYLQCLQLIIWKQCHWLVHAQGFPPELETIVRDLWGLRVGVIWKDSDKVSQSAFSSQVFSSQSEGETSGTEATDAKSLSSRRSRAQMVEKLPGLRETLALCYLGLLILRLPVSLGEMWTWATRDEIVFMRAIKEIPREMRRKLPAAFYSALELKAPFKGYTLHQTVRDLVLFFGDHFGMLCPPLNTHLLLYKHIQDFGLPVEIFPGVQNLISLLSMTFVFPSKLPSLRRNSTTYPEIQLISLIIIATKLLYPFDTIRRVPESDKDAAYIRMDWAEWSKIMIDLPSSDLKRGEEIHVKETDVWNMSGKTMDQYMDWYQRTWVEDDKPPKLAEQLLDMFPLTPIAQLPAIPTDLSQTTSRLKAVQSSLRVQKSWPPNLDPEERERINRPGELYKRYRTVDELSEHAKNFYELAARNVGVSVKMLVKEVFKIEVKLENWRLEERRRELFEDVVDEGEEEGGSVYESAEEEL